MKLNHLAPLLAGVAISGLAAQKPETPAVTRQDATDTAPAPNRCRVSQLLGIDVTNPKNESIGEIEDIVLDGTTRRIAYVVVSAGGFLGIGERYFAMPWRVLQVEQRSAEDAPRVTLGLDKDALSKAPGFAKDMWPDMANATWAGQVEQYYRERKGQPIPTGAKEPAGTGIDGTTGVDRAPSSKAFAHRRVSKVIGMAVVDDHGSALADVEDLVVDTRLATIDAAVLASGGVLGIGETLTVVPYSALILDAKAQRFTLSTSKTNFSAMAIKGGSLPSWNESAWLTRATEQCATAAAEQKLAARTGKPVEATTKEGGETEDAYDGTKVETHSGTVTTLGAVWIGTGKEERLRFRIRTAADREIVVHAAPATFAAQQELGLRAGHAVEVTGSPVRHGNQTVLVATTIVANGKTATLRDADGKPKWTTTRER